MRTVLTTPIGRIIDLLTVHVFAEGLLLVTSPGRANALFSHLRKNVFFNDKVKLEDASTSLSQRDLYGPKAPELLAALGLPGADLPLHAVVTASWHDQPLHVARIMPIAGAGFSLYAAAETLDSLEAALHQAGAGDLDPGTWNVLRVEQGYGAYGSELSQEFIPLETGLWDAISFKKGCYVGQEIIARMESRGRLAKQLRGLRFSDPPAEIALPTALTIAGKDAGLLTSLVESPRHGLIGLAYVRTAHCTADTAVSVADTSARVVDLPFS
ncbi:MAG: glycine cleavage system protein T [Oscillochloris sp.]|nr:glycine cleavage system protein T [Oscillochloris sp.]